MAKLIKAKPSLTSLNQLSVSQTSRQTFYLTRSYLGFPHLTTFILIPQRWKSRQVMKVGAETVSLLVKKKNPASHRNLL
jgi:hypothetical protein